jgi:very-short-patch-repair endonuclease
MSPSPRGGADLASPECRFRRVTCLDATVRNGVRVTAVARTIVDLADRPELEHVLDAALHKRLTTVDRMKEYVKPLRTKPGLKRLRRLLDDREKGLLTTELERRFDDLLQRSTLPYPARQHPIGAYFADFAYVEERIVLELDGGESHMRKEVFEHDRLRQNEIVLSGWLVIRFTWDDVTQRRDYVIRTVRQAIVERSSSKRAGDSLSAASPYGG